MSSPAPAATSSPSDLALFQGQIAALGLRPSSQRVYLSLCTAFLRRLGKPLLDCSTEDCEAAALAAGSLASAQRIFRMLERVGQAHPHALGRCDPQAFAPYLRQAAPRPTPRLLDPRGLTDTALGHSRLAAWRALQLRAMVELLSCTGARRSELAGLRWEDLEGGAARLGSKKTPRQLPLTEEAMQALQAWRQATPAPVGRVFIADEKGSPLLMSSMTRWLRRFCREQGRAAPEVSARAVRAQCAFRLYQEGATAEAVQQFLGHKRLESTMAYLRRMGAQV